MKNKPAKRKQKLISLFEVEVSETEQNFGATKSVLLGQQQRELSSEALIPSLNAYGLE